MFLAIRTWNLDVESGVLWSTMTCVSTRVLAFSLMFLPLLACDPGSGKSGGEAGARVETSPREPSGGAEQGIADVVENGGGHEIAEGEADAEPREVAQAAAPDPLGTLAIDWIALGAGSFSMQSDLDDSAHVVEVEGFEIAKTEVTQAQYQLCVEAGACTAIDWRTCATGKDRKRLELPELPVVCVDWAQSRAFAQFVGGDLPSEEQWAYAARSGGRDWDYPWGDEDASCDYAVMNWGCGRPSQNHGSAQPCSKPAGNSVQGVCDMAGNVAEWMGETAMWDAQGRKATTKINRGGSWHGMDPLYYRNSPKGPSLLRVAHRSRYGAKMRDDSLGFRPVRASHGR